MGRPTAQKLTRAIRNRCYRFKEEWEGFWFTPCDPINISLLRVLCGCLMLYSLLVWSLDLEAFFSQQSGWQSAKLVQALQHGQWAFSFWWYVPDNRLWLAHIICILLVTAYTVGLATNLTKFAALLIVVSYANRVPMANFGLDQILAALTLYLCLGPCGARFSVDRWWGQRRHQRSGESINWPRRSIGAGLALRMIQVHLCIMYFWSGISKLKGQSWWSGDAIWRIASNYEYQQVSLTWLANLPWLYQIATIGTWVWEISFSFLVWRHRSRLPVLLIGTMMHLSIGLFLGMWTFGLAMTCSYLAFTSPALLRRLAFQFGFGRRVGLGHHDREDDCERLPTLALSTVSTNVASMPLRLAVVHNEPNQSIQHTAPTNPYSDDDQLMLSEHDFDNVVLYVDSSTKRRSMMTEALEAAGIRCIGVDAWPEAIRMYNTLNLQGLLCNASRLQPTELRFWCSHLKGRPNSVHIALIQDIQLPAMKKHDLGGIILQIIPANIEAICQMLDLNNSGVAPVQVLSPQSDATSPPQTLDSEPHASNSAHIVKYPSAAH